MLKHIPNILTIIRFILIPVILYFIFTGNYILAFVFFTLSGITDILDGAIARKFNLISTFGKLMDPLADKLTQISVLATLVFKEIIPFWILIIVMLKEFIMIIGASFLYGKDKLSVTIYFILEKHKILIQKLFRSAGNNVFSFYIEFCSVYGECGI